MGASIGAGALAAFLCTSLAGAVRARADDAPAVPLAPPLPGADEEVPDDARITQLEERIEELSELLKQAEDQRARAVSPLSINGYADIGFFVPIGNHGIGWVRDVGNTQFPQYSGYSWTFLGDILSTAVNSRGEVANVGDAPGINRFDSVNSGGAPGFIANEVNLRLGYALTERATVRSSLNFAPRSGQNFALGDFFDVDIVELEYVATESGKTSIFVGKTLPVFGIEYKERKSDQRFGITPSLIARYTTGSQLGVKVRSKLLNDWLIVAASITNDSSGTEQFHFQSEIDKNSGKTANGRIALSIPVGELARSSSGARLEVGLSGEWGPQDWATDNSGAIWFAGLDVTYAGTNLALKAQAIRGGAPGKADGSAWGLELHNSGYLEVDWQPHPRLGILGRAEARDALVTLAMERAYLTKEMRFTGGLRLVFDAHIVLKVEYLHNQEYGGIQQFQNDIFTSSLVLAY